MHLSDPIPNPVEKRFDYATVDLGTATVTLHRYDVAYTLGDAFYEAGRHLEAVRDREAKRLGHESSPEDRAAAAAMNAVTRTCGPFGTTRSHATTTHLGGPICGHPECRPSDGGDAA